MSEDSIVQNLNKIKDAKKNRMMWTTLAETLVVLKKSPDMRREFPDRAAFWEMLAPHTGYSRNALQRMESTLRRIREIEKENREALRRTLGVESWENGLLLKVLNHFPKAEIFARMHRLDAAEARHLLERMTTERISVSQMKDVLRDVTNAHPDTPKFVVSRGEERTDPREWFVRLDNNKGEIYSGIEVGIYYRQYAFSYVSADAIAISCNDDGGIAFIDAFQVVTNLEEKTDDGFRDLLSAIDYRSSFFRHVWLVLVGEARKADSFATNYPVESLEHGIDELGIQGIGIIRLSDEGDLDVVRLPRGGDKPTRYRSVLTDVMRQGVPDFGAP